MIREEHKGKNKLIWTAWAAPGMIFTSEVLWSQKNPIYSVLKYIQ